MKQDSITLYAVIQCNLHDQPYVSNYTDEGEILLDIWQQEEDAKRACDMLRDTITYCAVKPIIIY